MKELHWNETWCFIIGLDLEVQRFVMILVSLLFQMLYQVLHQLVELLVFLSLYVINDWCDINIKCWVFFTGYCMLNSQKLFREHLRQLCCSICHHWLEIWEKFQNIWKTYSSTEFRNSFLHGWDTQQMCATSISSLGIMCKFMSERKQ